MGDDFIQVATASDIPHLELLVNQAYRGEEAKKGWTYESDLIEGELRTDASMLTEMMDDPEAVILKFGEGKQILGCVYLQKKGDVLYLGMLSVSPGQQAKGIGKKLLKAAEERAASLGCTSIEMTVISERQALISWYERHGYHLTGEKKPFHTDARYGKPRRPIEFVVMGKKVVGSR